MRDHFTDAECVVGEETLGFWNVLDAFIYSALPATLLVLLDIFIVCRLHRALKARRMPESLCKDPQRRKSVATHLETLNHQQQQLQQIQQKQQQHCEHMLMTSSRGRIPNRNCHCFRGSEPILVAGERFKERLPNKEFIAPLDGRRSIQNIRDSSGVPSVSRQFDQHNSRGFDRHHVAAAFSHNYIRTSDSQRAALDALTSGAEHCVPRPDAPHLCRARGADGHRGGEAVQTSGARSPHDPLCDCRAARLLTTRPQLLPVHSHKRQLPEDNQALCDAQHSLYAAARLRSSSSRHVHQATLLLPEKSA